MGERNLIDQDDPTCAIVSTDCAWQASCKSKINLDHTHGWVTNFNHTNHVTSDVAISVS